MDYKLEDFKDDIDVAKALWSLRSAEKLLTRAQERLTDLLIRKSLELPDEPGASSYVATSSEGPDDFTKKT